MLGQRSGHHVGLLTGSQQTIRLLNNPINLGGNFDGSMDVDPKIPLFLHTDKNLAINPVFCIQIRPSKMNHFIFFRVEFHLPLLCPALHPVNVP
eukprot:g22922.t1